MSISHHDPLDVGFEQPAPSAPVVAGVGLAIRTWAWPTVAFLAGVVAILRINATAPLFTNIVDEPFHIAAAAALYDVHKHTMGIEAPPLPRLVAGLPLHLAGVHLPPQYRTRTVANELTSCEAGAEILFDGRLGYEPTLELARHAMLIFPALALLYLYLLGRWLAGPATAALGVVFFSLDPTLLGHGTWVATDVPAAAGFLAAVYHGSRWIVLGGRGRAVAAGAAIGLAIACKFSCMLVIPSLGLLAMALRLRHRPLRAGIGQMVIAGIVAFICLWATYLFDIGPMGDQNRFPPESEWRLIPDWIKQTPVPMPSFGLGMLWLAGHGRSGHPAYLNGELSRSGWWYYFPEAIALKTPIGALLAGALAATAIPKAMRRARRHGGCRKARLGHGPVWRRIGILAIPATVFLLAGMAGKIVIGIRHILPGLALLYLLMCIILVRARLTVALGACILVAAIETGWAHPDYLSFFNLAAGGPARADRYLIDSNLDWGQDIGRLAHWLRTSPQAAGRPYSARLFMFPRSELLQHVGLDPSCLEGRPHGLFAISKNISRRLFGFDVKKDGTIVQAPDYSWLSGYPLVKRIGNSIDVYDLGDPNAPTQCALPSSTSPGASSSRP